MFSRQSITRARVGMMLTALVVALPTAAWAQWWGPYGYPVGAPPRPAVPPAPPSVGGFMSNPGSATAAIRGGASQPDDCSEQQAAAYYVIGPGMTAYVLPSTVTRPCKAETTAQPPVAEAAREGREKRGKMPVRAPRDGDDTRATTVAAQETASGEILVDAEGMTLYVSGGDQLGESFCYADCARNWPPAKAPSDAKAHGDLAVISRNDGTRQWAFKGQPLYRWAGDKRPGDMTGDGLGSAWAVARIE